MDNKTREFFEALRRKKYEVGEKEHGGLNPNKHTPEEMISEALKEVADLCNYQDMATKLIETAPASYTAFIKRIFERNKLKAEEIADDYYLLLQVLTDMRKEMEG